MLNGLVVETAGNGAEEKRILDDAWDEKVRGGKGRESLRGRETDGQAPEDIEKDMFETVERNKRLKRGREKRGERIERERDASFELERSSPQHLSLSQVAPNPTLLNTSKHHS